MIQKEIDLGPIHPWLPGMMKLNVSLEGDRIVTAVPEFGYASRRIIEKTEGKNFIEAQRCFSRIDPESAFIADRIYSELIEQATGTQITARAAWIRDIAAEMVDAVSALRYLSAMASQFGIHMLSHLLRKHREELLDLVERLSGSRYGYFYIIPGGTRYDITDGFLERVEVWSKQYIKDFERIKAMFCWTHPFQNRLDQLGLVLDDGKYGFISEARVETSKLGWNSSVGSRLRYAMGESFELAESILELSRKIEGGDYYVKIPDSASKKKVEAKFETLRGSWDVSFDVGSNLNIKTTSVSTPSDQIKNAIPLLLEGEAFDDIPIILASANLSVTEVDR
ncbi:MAG: hypothetical protein JST80_07420 [Bdellovibrionales bacterium]|nr:hypothetical protein [Bdellovibrionales bacterium]